MKKAFVLIIAVLVFGGADSFGRNEPLANEGKDGLYVKSIEQVLRLDESEIDLGTAVLIISEQWNQNVYGRRYLTRLDDMAFEIRRRLEAKNLQPNYRAIEVINDYLFDESGFKSVKDAGDPKDLFLHTVLDKKRGYCLSLSVLYLSLGERLGLPLYGVVVPEHFFIRYDDGQVRFNIETTGKGGSADDEHYIKKFGVPTDNGDSIYMKNLSKKQTLGCFLNNLGNSYNDVGDADAALRALERAVDLNPSLAESLTNLGNMYLNEGYIADAVYKYQAALKINPRDAKTHNNLGNAYFQRGRVNDAIAEYTQALKLDANFTEVYKNLAGAYCKKEMYELAIMQLDHAITMEPKNAGLYIQFGDVYSQMNDYKRAITQYKKALKIDSDLAEAHYGLAVCYGKSGMADDEIRAYKKALAIKPDMAAALANLGNAYFSRKQYDKAIEQYKKAIQVNPDDGAIHYNLGAAYSNTEHYGQAAVEYQEAIEIEPDMGDAHNGLAFVFYKLKQYHLADKHIKIAGKLNVEINKDLLTAIEKKL